MKVILLDIEGTIGDIKFVREILFPYSRSRVSQYLHDNWQTRDLQEIVASARRVSGKTLNSYADAARQFIEWIDEDKKITPLKSLQGLIWRQGYESGELKAHLYDDAVVAIHHWHKQGKRLYIYSSGSIAAQKLYLSYSVAGNLLSHFSGFFDTTTGPKTESSSYEKIATAINSMPGDITFYSDAATETQAAQQAGFVAVGVDRQKSAYFLDQSTNPSTIGSFTPVMSL